MVLPMTAKLYHEPRGRQNPQIETIRDDMAE
jgi:hypothetical protein